MESKSPAYTQILEIRNRKYWGVELNYYNPWITKNKILLLILERGERREKEKEKERNINVREKHCTCPNGGLNPQPRHVLCPRIKLVTFRFAG